jgi:hypothetical protein
MHQIETDIIINAPPARVYNELINIEKYSDWNPFIISGKGQVTKNAHVDFIMKSSDTKTMGFKPKILVIDENKEFRWFGKLALGGLFDGEHYFVLQEQDDGSTKLIHGEKFKGLLIPIAKNMINASTKPSFVKMNDALKIRCETGNDAQ